MIFQIAPVESVCRVTKSVSFKTIVEIPVLKESVASGVIVTTVPAPLAMIVTLKSSVCSAVSIVAISSSVTATAPPFENSMVLF